MMKLIELTCQTIKIFCPNWRSMYGSLGDIESQVTDGNISVCEKVNFVGGKIDKYFNDLLSAVSHCIFKLEAYNTKGMNLICTSAQCM